MPDDKTEVRVGRSRVKYGGVDLGFTEGEIVFTYTPEFRMFRPDQNTGPCKVFLVNEDVKVTVPLAQSGAKSLAAAKAYAAGELKATKAAGGGDSTLAAAASAGASSFDVQVGAGSTYTADQYVLVGTGPTAELVQIDTVATDTINLKAATPLQYDHASGEAAPEVDPAKTRIALGNQLSIPTAELLIEPVDTSDPNDIKVYKAYVSDEVELSMQKGEENVVEVTFSALADTSRSDGDQMASIGDQSV